MLVQTVDQQQEEMNALLEHLRNREGYETKVYKDTKGFLTAGMGHKLTGFELERYKEGDEISQEQIVEWQKQDIKTARNAADKQMKDLNITNSKFKNALTSVNFQLGASWHTKFPKAYEALKKGDYDKAIYEIEHNSKGESSAWKKDTPVRVEDFRNAIEGLKPIIPEGASLTGGRSGENIHTNYGTGVVKEGSPEHQALLEKQNKEINQVISDKVGMELGTSGFQGFAKVLEYMFGFLPDSNDNRNKGGY